MVNIINNTLISSNFNQLFYFKNYFQILYLKKKKLNFR